MIELHAAMKKLIAELSGARFNGVHVDAKDADCLQKSEVVHIPDDPSSCDADSAELTDQQWAERERDYSIIRIEPDFFSLQPRNENKYVEVEVCEDQFWLDMLTHIRNAAGPGVKITHHKGTNEIELEREGSTWHEKSNPQPKEQSHV